MCECATAHRQEAVKASGMILMITHTHTDSGDIIHGDGKRLSAA